MYRALLLVFLSTMAIDWPGLPFNARLTDLMFLLLAAATVAQGRRADARPYLVGLDYAIAAYLAGSLAATVFSPAPSAGVVEIVRECYLVAVYLIIVEAVRRGFADSVATGIAASGTLLAAGGLLMLLVLATIGIEVPAIGPVITLPYLGETLRLRALTATPAMLACVLAVALPFTLSHPWVRAEPRRLWVLAAILGAAACWTFSHAIAGVAVAALITAWPSLRSPSVRVAAAAATLAIVIAFNFAATVSIRAVGAQDYRDATTYQYAVDGGRTTVAGVDVEYQTMSYFRLKQVALDAFLRRPVTGLGLDRSCGRIRDERPLGESPEERDQASQAPHLGDEILDHLSPVEKLVVRRQDLAQLGLGDARRHGPLRGKPTHYYQRSRSPDRTPKAEDQPRLGRSWLRARRQVAGAVPKARLKAREKAASDS